MSFLPPLRHSDPYSWERARTHLLIIKSDLADEREERSLGANMERAVIHPVHDTRTAAARTHGQRKNGLYAVRNAGRRLGMVRAYLIPWLGPSRLARAPSEQTTWLTMRARHRISSLTTAHQMWYARPWVPRRRQAPERRCEPRVAWASASHGHVVECAEAAFTSRVRVGGLTRVKFCPPRSPFRFQTYSVDVSKSSYHLISYVHTLDVELCDTGKLLAVLAQVSWSQVHTVSISEIAAKEDGPVIHSIFCRCAS
ncbi:hypothetical protein B0H14DRAFT_3527682 [Mycena olivaceomarginata]|nr:hypothetical protein B0H14DRAFT_3527682 [Mycena olivaceomarginata]